MGAPILPPLTRHADDAGPGFVSETGAPTGSAAKRMDAEAFAGLFRSQVEDAIEWKEEIGLERAAAIDYYKGRPFGDEEDGRSKVISTDVRDTVRAMLPSLMRVFCGSDHPVEFAARTGDDVGLAEQITDYVRYVIRSDNAGFLVLYTALKDALVCRSGIVRWWWERKITVEQQELSGLDEMAVALLVENAQNDPNIEYEVTQNPETGLFEGAMKRRAPAGRVRIAAVPPEEFFINRSARSIEEARICGQIQMLTVADLVALGYDEEMVIAAATTDAEEVYQNAPEYLKRRPSFQSDDHLDESQMPVEYVEAYWRIDADGDGIAELRRVCAIGARRHVVYDEPVSEAPFAMFLCDPEPHELFGSSVADVTMDIQRVKSQVLRAMLNSLAQAVDLKLAVVEGQVNMDDVLSKEIGVPVRMNAPGMVAPLNTPFLGKECFPVLSYFDDTRQTRTGMSRAAAGLDPDSLQSSTRAAVAATVTASREAVELVARLLAESGLRPLYRGILRTLVSHQDKARTVKLRGQWVTVDPTAWDAEREVEVKVPVGEAATENKISALTALAAKQEQILQTLGPQNPLVTLAQYRETLRRLLELSGIKDVESFLLVPSDEAVRAMSEAAASAGKDPNAELIAQVEIEKKRADIQAQQAELQFRESEAARKHELELRKLEQEMALKLRELELRETELRMRYMEQKNAAAAGYVG